MNARTLSAYILQALALAQTEGRIVNLESLTDDLKVRRKDIRAAVSQLHREGMLDVLTMRLSLRGFAIGRSLQGQRLPELRVSVEPARAAVA
jgi:biotin operon repressor